MAKILLFAAFAACIIVPFRVFVKGEQTKKRYKSTLALNGVMFFGLMLFTGVMMFSGSASAAETAGRLQLRQPGCPQALAIWQQACPSAFPVSAAVLP